MKMGNLVLDSTKRLITDPIIAKRRLIYGQNQALIVIQVNKSM